MSNERKNAQNSAVNALWETCPNFTKNYVTYTVLTFLLYVLAGPTKWVGVHHVIRNFQAVWNISIYYCDELCFHPTTNIVCFICNKIKYMH